MIYCKNCKLFYAGIDVYRCNIMKRSYTKRYNNKTGLVEHLNTDDSNTKLVKSVIFKKYNDDINLIKVYNSHFTIDHTIYEYIDTLNENNNCQFYQPKTIYLIINWLKDILKKLK